MSTNTINIPTRPVRTFVSNDLKVDSWSKLQQYFQDLLDATISNVSELEKWLHNRSELESVMEEEMAWRYIKMNIDTTDEKLAKDFSFWITEISPNVAPYSHQLNKKVYDSPYLKELDNDKYFIY